MTYQLTLDIPRSSGAILTTAANQRVLGAETRGVDRDMARKPINYGERVHQFW